MDDSYIPKKNNKLRWLGIILIVLIVVAGILFVINQDNNDTGRQNAPPTTQPVAGGENNTVNSLVGYQLPDGWSKVECGGENDTVLIVPAQRVKPDCAALAGDWPMKIWIDALKTTDCNQIKVDSQQVTNHVCESKYINGTKTLVASTTFNSSSKYGKNTKVSDYYFIANGKVVKLEYADDLASPEDDYQAQFDQIANSVKAK
jgi:hypothetical protein